MDQSKKRASDRAAQKRLREKRKSSGMCYKCGRHAAVDGRSKCEECLSIQRDSHHARRKLLIKKQRCSKCGGEKQHASICEVCFLKGRALRHFGSSDAAVVLKEVFDRDGGVCPYTGRRLTLGVDAALDHKTSKKAGGNNDPSNLQWVYIPANNAKWHMSEEEFLDLIKEIYRHRLHPG